MGVTICLSTSGIYCENQFTSGRYSIATGTRCNTISTACGNDITFCVTANFTTSTLTRSANASVAIVGTCTKVTIKIARFSSRTLKTINYRIAVTTALISGTRTRCNGCACRRSGGVSSTGAYSTMRNPLPRRWRVYSTIKSTEITLYSIRWI